MEEIYELMVKYYKKTGDKLRFEVYPDGSGGFENSYTGATVVTFDDIHSICEVLEDCVNNIS